MASGNDETPDPSCPPPKENLNIDPQLRHRYHEPNNQKGKKAQKKSHKRRKNLPAIQKDEIKIKPKDLEINEEPEDIIGDLETNEEPEMIEASDMSDWEVVEDESLAPKHVSSNRTKKETKDIKKQMKEALEGEIDS